MPYGSITFVTTPQIVSGFMQAHVSAAEFQGHVVGAEIGNKRSTMLRKPGRFD
jgi:hypothetical protein